MVGNKCHFLCTSHFSVAFVVPKDEASHGPLVVDPIVEGSGIESSKIKTRPFENKCLDLKFKGDFNGGMKT